MHNLLLVISRELQIILQTNLLLLADDWWERHVLAVLTYQQQERVKQSRINDFSCLDLAALLRVLDQNWYELSQQNHWPKEGRNWLKEAQTIRNRWAHATITAVEPQDVYRDCDTLERLSAMLGASHSTLANIAEYKQQQLILLAQPLAPSVAITPTMPPPVNVPAGHRFVVGQLLCLKSNRTCQFPVMQVLESPNSERRYQVFENNKISRYYESQLEAVEHSPDERSVLPLADFHARLSALLLTSPGSGNLYSLHAGRVRHVPYQYRPVIKLLHADRPRLLIADDVGVGKTIEAGLIIKELQARSELAAVLIICPKALVAEQKWQNEMRRFGESFAHLDSGTLRYCLDETDKDGSWPSRYARSIVPFSLLNSELLDGQSTGRKRKKGLRDLDPPPHFDLVIVDEAHHIRNADTWTHRSVRFFCDHAEAVIFLTATPIQLGNQDLFTLLSVLRPDLVIDQASFAQMSEPNQFIHNAANAIRRQSADWQRQAKSALLEVRTTVWGDFFIAGSPEFQQILDTLGDKACSTGERIALLHKIESLSTFNALINRTRRRDIGDFTTRKPETVSVLFSNSQQQLHDQLLRVAGNIYSVTHGQQMIRFMLSTLRRQAASCLHALRPMLEQWLANKFDELELAEEDDSDSGPPLQLPSVNGLQQQILELIDAANALEEADPKLDAFINIVRNKQALPNNKLLVFTSFRHTLFYLAEHLKAAGVRVGLMHGGVADDERREVRQRFALPRDEEHALDILLSTEVGSEGLDFQFCDAIVNYDLPWNPMRIEQRIGRIDRYGQQSETVAIYNLVTPGTIDAEIYERCLWRIGVFQAALGASEEILGQITKELHDISENLSLTPAERESRLQQLTDNELRAIHEQETLEKQQAELFGLSVPNINGEMATSATGDWLLPNSLHRLVAHYLNHRCGKPDAILGEKPLKTLRLDKEARMTLLDEFRQQKAEGAVALEWERWLKGTDQHLSVTFEQDCACDHASAALLHAGHPLVQAAARHQPDSNPIYGLFRVPALADVAAGCYPFALYHWHKRGARNDNEMVAVVADAHIEEHLFDLLAKADEARDAQLPDQEAFDALEANHHQRWRDALANHQEQNQQRVAHQLQSLEASHKARLALIADKLQGVTDEKIIRMREGERTNIEADYRKRKSQLEIAAKSADIRAEAVAFGVLVVEEER